MNKIGIGIDYSNICKDYNTVYLDRDNTDPATTKCMKQVLGWSQDFLSTLLKHFNLKLFKLNTDKEVAIDDIASKRFLFYSLEKEITLQSYMIAKEYTDFTDLTLWEEKTQESILVQNDEDGGAIYLFCEKDSAIHHWILQNLTGFSLDEVALEKKR